VDGYNVCIFAYGQTGSGKTYLLNWKMNQWNFAFFAPSFVLLLMLSYHSGNLWHVPSFLTIFFLRNNIFYAFNESRNSLQVQTETGRRYEFFPLTLLNYTMIGDKELKSPGIAPRAMTAIFSLMDEQKWVWIIFVE